MMRTGWGENKDRGIVVAALALSTAYLSGIPIHFYSLLKFRRKAEKSLTQYANVQMSVLASDTVSVLLSVLNFILLDVTKIARTGAWCLLPPWINKIPLVILMPNMHVVSNMILLALTVQRIRGIVCPLGCRKEIKHGVLFLNLIAYGLTFGILALFCTSVHLRLKASQCGAQNGSMPGSVRDLVCAHPELAPDPGQLFWGHYSACHILKDEAERYGLAILSLFSVVIGSLIVATSILLFYYRRRQRTAPEKKRSEKREGDEERRKAWVGEGAKKRRRGHESLVMLCLGMETAIRVFITLLFFFAVFLSYRPQPASPNSPTSRVGNEFTSNKMTMKRMVILGIEMAAYSVGFLFTIFFPIVTCRSYRDNGLWSLWLPSRTRRFKVAVIIVYFSLNLVLSSVFTSLILSYFLGQ